MEINPINKEYHFSPNSLKNTVINELSSYIANKLFDNLNLKQTVGVTSQILDFPKINEALQGIMTPNTKKKEYYLYSFCKYSPQPNEDKTQIYIFLFIFGQKGPVKAKVVIDSSSSQICTINTYLNHVMINFIGKINTLVIGVPVSAPTESGQSST